MKPNFALSLSLEGIGLLHRAFPGWNRVGEVALDSADLPGALAVLRDTAQQINGQDLHSKLVIPNDQIKYITLDLGIMTEDQRHSAIHEALTGATPYPVDNLVFDWSVEGDHTHVAAVARETLAEAEDFATAHGFIPLSFVAIPPEGAFSGEPFFGQSSLAPDLLPEGETVQRDMAPIRITGVVRLPDPEDDLPGDPVAEAATPAVEADTTPESQEPTPEPAETTEPEADTPPTPAPDPVPPFTHAEPDDDAPTPEPTDHPDDISAQAEATAPEHSDTAQDDAQEDTPDDTPDDTAEADLLHASLLSDTLPEIDAPIVATPPRHDSETPAAPPFSTIRAERGSDISDPAPALSGVSRGAADLTTPAPSISALDEVDNAATPAIDATPESYEGDDWLTTDTTADAPAPVAEDAPAFDTPEPVAPTEDTAPTDAAPGARERMSFLSERSGEMAAGLTASLARRGDGPSDADRARERERMTVFGARKSDPDTVAVGGKPRYLGLILTLVLLLFLAGVAAWASLFMEDGLARFFAPRDTAVAMLPPDAEDEIIVEGEEAMVPEVPEPSDVSVETTTRTMPPAALPAPAEPAPAEPAPAQPEIAAPAPAATPPLAQPHALSASEAQARYAVTGVWQRAPQSPQLPDETSLDTLYLTSIDPPVDAQDAVALPTLASLRTDVTPGRIAPPVPQGATFDMDERGLVIATPDGALSPEGFQVYAGRPAAVPDTIPGVTTRDTPAVTAEKSALAAKRPKSRPDGLIENNERSTLGGLTRAELAAKRPKTRPAALVPEPAVAPAAVTQAIAEATAETATAQPAVAAAPQIIGTEFAVAQSRKPKTRPGNFSRIVQRAEKARVTKVAAVPRQQTTAPAIPSRANVAKAATVRNQINLRKINLIGVYGKPSARRALVRLSNGRYKKVKVGDRLDGGRISAIGEAELRYTKRGRNVILKMPRS